MKDIIADLVLGLGACCMYLAGFLHSMVIQGRPKGMTVQLKITGASSCSEVMESMSNALRSKSG